MTEIIPLKPKSTGFKTRAEGGPCNELNGMADRLEELAEGSNMENWIKQLASSIRSTAEAYKKQN